MSNIPRIRHELAHLLTEDIRRVVYLLHDCNISREKAVEAICCFIAGNKPALPDDEDREERKPDNDTSV